MDKKVLFLYLDKIDTERSIEDGSFNIQDKRRLKETKGAKR